MTKKNINEIRKGNSLAFRDLYNVYYASLCRFAYTFLDTQEEAEDIV